MHLIEPLRGLWVCAEPVEDNFIEVYSQYIADYSVHLNEILMS